MNDTRQLPDPSGPSLLRSIGYFFRFTAGLPWSVRQHASTLGDLHRLRLGIEDIVFVLHPDDVEALLHNCDADLIKDPITHMLDGLLGDGLLTSEGRVWRDRRRLIAPKLSRRHVDAYADEMVRATEDAVASWRDGASLDLHHTMMELTLDIVARTLFGDRVGADTERIGAALDQAMHDFHLLVHTWRRLVPRSVPLAPRRRLAACARDVDDVVERLIAGRRAEGLTGDDLLTLLIRASDAQPAPIDARGLRNEAATILAAGHETTANALTYAFALLAKHPDALSRMTAEVEQVLGAGPATANDLTRLPFTRAVALESLRLYPPAWIFGREVTDDVQVAGRRIARGSVVLMVPFFMHRDARWFDAPDAFRPQRWLDGLEQRLPRYAFCPFGGGKRVCIGNHFAMLELVMVLATLCRRVSFEWHGTLPLKVQTSVTLRPNQRIDVQVRTLSSAH